MSYTKVKNYTDKQLLGRVKSLDSFRNIPNEYWILGVRSNENSYNIYDDKFYLFNGDKFVMTLTGTTNSGSYGFENYFKWNSQGVGEIKSNEWYYDVWKYGLHKGKMEALIQVGGFKIIRKKSNNSSNKDWNWEYWKGFNFHCNSYKFTKGIKNWFINGWSVGCQVVNNLNSYYLLIGKVKNQKLITYCLIDEF